MRVETSFHSIVWCWTGRLGGGREVASHFLASSAASRLPLNFPSCSQGRGGDVSAPGKGRKFIPEPPAFLSPAGPCWNQGCGRNPVVFLQKTFAFVSTEPSTPDPPRWPRCVSRGLRQIMGPRCLLSIP